jgi:hypothetical protein
VAEAADTSSHLTLVTGCSSFVSGWIENLRFSVELCRDATNFEEVVAR